MIFIFIDGIVKTMWRRNKITSDGYRFLQKKDHISILGYNGQESDLTIPDTINSLPVTTIDVSAFAHNATIETIMLPDSITQLSKSAFEGCTSLREIELGEGIEIIEQRSFASCVSLRSVCLPYWLKSVKKEAFEGCVSLVELYYYNAMKGGVSASSKSKRSTRESILPNGVEYIGPRAFKGCTSLDSFYIPYKLRKISSQLFEDCTALAEVHVHNIVKTIGSQSFKGCSLLQEIRLPLSCKTIGENAFEPTVQIVSSPKAHAAKYAQANGLRWRGHDPHSSSLKSHMVPYKTDKPYVSFYDEPLLEDAIECYEMRMPAYKLINRIKGTHNESVAIPSRFSFEDGIYRRTTSNDKVRIMMVGDLMCNHNQQKVALDIETNKFSFDFSFSYVKSLLQQSDLAIGGLESMISPSAPYHSEKIYVDARAHLNGPVEFLEALRKAGFDAVINAQNHAYDTGTRGVFETLDNQNRHQLMHTGMFVSNVDKRYLMIEISGIKIAIVAYLDGNRQLMKRANFTKEGRDIMFPVFNEERAIEDIKNARKDGAEFVISFCHWGREYTPELSSRQKKFALMVANAGADYLVGAHSHCLQPYEIIDTDDGRKVPCLYSAGNFLSTINYNPPITRDSLILEIELERTQDGSVKLASERYHPCRIVNLRRPKDNKMDYAVVPTNTVMSSQKLNTIFQRAHQRIMETIGDSIKAVPISNNTNE